MGFASAKIFMCELMMQICSQIVDVTFKGNTEKMLHECYMNVTSTI